MHYVSQHLDLNGGVMAICNCGWKSDVAANKREANDLFEVHRKENE
jgi:hypothetical protein